MFSTTTPFCKELSTHYLRLALLLVFSVTALPRSWAQSGSVTTQTQSFSYTGQIETWTVPAGVTSLTIEAKGAEGGNQYNNAGKGAILRGHVAVSPSQQLTIVVGGQGGAGGGGGGGSFVVALGSPLQPLIIAGGGGGSGYSTNNSTSYDGISKQGQTGQDGGAAPGPANLSGAGGTARNGGKVGGQYYSSAGGGGLSTSGEDAVSSRGGQSFIEGAQGGSSSSGGNGGFGGGGGSFFATYRTSQNSLGGGGGGYSGGGGISTANDGRGGGGPGGGGGSYNADPSGTSLSGAADGNSGNGLVNISYIQTCTPFTVKLRDDGPLTCVKKSVTLTTTDGPSGASYTYSTGAQASSASSTTATVTNSGFYSVTATISGGCSATATTNVQSNTVAPNAPSLVTQSGYPYPAGVSSLTISQNVGPVSLTASGCSDGQLSTSGGSVSSFTISTANTGTQTYTATCTSTSNGCTSPAGSFRLTVVPPTLTVSHLDATYGQLNTNTIKPYLQLNNVGANPIPYNTVTVRYWLTVEGTSPITNFQTYYVQLGAQNVQTRYVALPQPRQGASAYVEYSFQSGAGGLTAMSNSGPIQTGFAKADYSAFNQADDYSYMANRDYTLNPRITAYVNGQIAYGMEPTAVSSQTAVQLYSATKDGPTGYQAQPRVELRNTGNVALAVQDLRIRYYFTSDNNQTASVYVDYADIGAANVQARVIKLPAPVGGADSYVELRTLPTSMSLAAMSSLGVIDFRIVRSDQGMLDQSNDYSYLANYGEVALNNRITVLLNNRLIFGTPPSGAPARVSASEPVVGALSIKVLGNPVDGKSAQVEISGAEGQAVRLELTDLQGRPLHQQLIDQAGVVERVSVPVGGGSGIFLLQVATPTQRQQIKLVKP